MENVLAFFENLCTQERFFVMIFTTLWIRNNDSKCIGKQVIILITNTHGGPQIVFQKLWQLQVCRKIFFFLFTFKGIKILLLLTQSWSLVRLNQWNPEGKPQSYQFSHTLPVLSTNEKVAKLDQSILVRHKQTHQCNLYQRQIN